MTEHRPTNGAVRLPSWVLRWIALPLMLACAEFLGWSFVSNMGEQKTQNVKIIQLENRMVILEEEQKRNTEARIKFQDFRAQYDKDSAAMFANQELILKKLDTHERILRRLPQGKVRP